MRVASSRSLAYLFGSRPECLTPLGIRFGRPFRTPSASTRPGCACFPTILTGAVI